MIFLIFLLFMNSYAPLGNTWLDWHAQRIFNAVEFLRINGLFTNFGFTIWDSCKDCSLELDGWKEKLYFSINGVSLLPYYIINFLWGKEALFILGPMLDKLIIFSCAILVSELMIKSIKHLTHFPIYLIGVSVFALFSLSPWSYKMILAAWFEIYFLLFFLLGIFAFINSKNNMAYFSFFLAGLFHYQWAAAVAIFYALLLLAPFFLRTAKFDRPLANIAYFPPNSQKYYIIISLIVPALMVISLGMVAQQYIEVGTGSSIFSRIGIAGHDIHNGGLLGALQFLGGNRITQCLGGSGLSDISNNMDLMIKIAMFNCILSIAGMALLSFISIIGVYLLIRKSPLAKWTLLPLIFAMLIFISVLQQSLSAHLMGYSFIFAVLFSAGITNIMLVSYEYFNSKVLGLIFSFPCVIGVLLLSIRVSMLTGVNS
tara:strand:+ start:1187 stop:2470 length:1284 start_codon:yes stop_codon:yes gene_type:complete